MRLCAPKFRLKEMAKKPFNSIGNVQNSMFRFPSLAEIYYRIWRLRRLIMVAAMLPALCFAMLSVWLGASGEMSGLRIVSFTLTCIGVVSAHAILFPNATIEALSLSLGLVVSPGAFS